MQENSPCTNISVLKIKRFSFLRKKLLFLSEKIKVCAKEVCGEMNVRVSQTEEGSIPCNNNRENTR